MARGSGTRLSLSLFVLAVMLGGCLASNPNYNEALAKALLFFQGQRSGTLPANQQIQWRDNSGLSDGSLEHVDLTGGYYDAGDNVKFNFRWPTPQPCCHGVL
ncbi:unnamed protein product [Rhodiola kirilowii]